jgi:hypothetical protein
MYIKAIQKARLHDARP